MKKYLLFAVFIVVGHSILAQQRIASRVEFKIGKEPIAGILIRPDQNNDTPAVVFRLLVA